MAVEEATEAVVVTEATEVVDTAAEAGTTEADGTVAGGTETSGSALAGAGAGVRGGTPHIIRTIIPLILHTLTIQRLPYSSNSLHMFSRRGSITGIFAESPKATILT